MKFALSTGFAALALGAALTTPAAAQNRPTIAIMPAQYFSADAASADNVTQGLTQQFESKGYQVVPMDRSRSTFQTMNLSPSMHYADRVAINFGRSAGADIVAYPRLLGVGLPAATNGAAVKEGDLLEPQAVMHLRVINVHTGRVLYFRQVGHEFRTAGVEVAKDFSLPSPVAVATSEEVTQMYFERVAGSRQETRR